MKIPRKIKRNSKYSNIFLGCLFAVATFMLLSIGGLVTGAWFTDTATSSDNYAVMRFGTVDLDLNDNLIDVDIDENTCFYNQTQDVYYLIAGSSFTINHCAIYVTNTSTVPIYYTIRNGINYYVINDDDSDAQTTDGLINVNETDGLMTLANTENMRYSNEVGQKKLPYLLPGEDRSYEIANNWVCTLKSTANVGDSDTALQNNVWTINNGTIQFDAYSNVLPTTITANGAVTIAENLLNGLYQIYAVQANNIDFSTAKTEIMPQVAVVDYDGGVQGANAPLDGEDLEIVNGVVTLPSANPTKENYTFAGWEIDYAVNSAGVVDGDAVVSNGTTTLTNQTSSAIIRAKWEFAGLKITMQTNSQTYNITADVLEEISLDVVDSEATYTSGTATLSDAHYSFEGDLLPSTLTIGDTITLPSFTYNETQYDNIKFIMIGFNHDTYNENTSTAGITFQSEKTLFQSYMGNWNSYYANGFGNSTIKSTLNGNSGFFSQLTEDIRNIIKSATKRYNKYSDGSDPDANNLTGDFKIWLLSVAELGADATNYGGTDGYKQYKYYEDYSSNHAIAIKNDGTPYHASWSLRSASSTSGNYAANVGSSGEIGNIYAVNPCYVSPCFCI